MPPKYAWNFVLSCENEIQLENFLDTQKQWIKKKSQPEICQVCPDNIDIHLKRYRLIQCKVKCCKPRGACEWVLKVLQCQSTDETRVYQHHFHLSAAPPSREPNELNYAMKRFIKEHAEAGEKPAHIMHAIVAALNIEEPDPAVQLPRVQSVVRTFRAKSLLNNDYVDVMLTQASKHRFRDDLGEITAFAFGFDCDTEVEPDIGKGTAEMLLVVGVLTKKMIRRLERAPECVFHLDATFKLNNKGFPVVVMGLSDMWRQFHPVALFLMSDLKQPQWNRAIRAVCELYRRVSSSSVSLSHVMVDADNAQRSAFEKVASELLAADKQPDFLMCFFHVMTNVRKHTATFSKKDKQLIYKHVYRIHYARTPEDKKPEWMKHLSRGK